MIKFFRKIRQRLLTENKFNKYLIYAVGEIVLVVIGILIALQINTWNEQRKHRVKLGSNLILIKESLENDLKLIDTKLATLDIFENSGTYLLNFLLDKSEAVDSTQLKKSFLTAGFYIDFSLNSVPFEKLAKENYLELITNDSILMVLSNFYKKNDWEKMEIAQGNQQILKDYRNYTPNFTDRFTIRNALIQLSREDGVSQEAYNSIKFSYESMEVNWNKMKSDNKFQITLDKVLIGRWAIRMNFYDMRANISNLLKMLDAEIEKLT